MAIRFITGNFEPQGQSKTFGEMERSEKHALSMRGIAAKKLREFILAAS
jgi:inosine/xanthosine triphosphate pyrophosphatase family protein